MYRSNRGESAGRCFRQWAAASGSRAQAHRRAGADGRATVRHLAPASRVARLRQQDPDALLRDRIHETWIECGVEGEAKGKQKHSELTRSITYGIHVHVQVL